MKKQLLFLVMMMLPLVASADAVEINGIYYNLITKAQQAEVTSNPNQYTGSIVIPESVNYNEVTYSVTSIGNKAFRDCSALTSIKMPNSVTSIGGEAFAYCIGLTSVTIPNSVTTIIFGAFAGCYSLTSINIPNSVTKIDDEIFSGCSSLTSIIIPNSVTSIGGYAFLGCSGLTSITIPNSVTSIGDYAFANCSGLTSVTIGCGVTSIGDNAFDGVDIPTIISLIENPFKITGKTSDSRTFSQNTFNNATLYVPKGTIDKYKATDGWKDFLFIEEGTGGGNTPTTQKCEKPTISYENGKLTFSCATEGATCYYSITDSDIKSGNGEKVDLTVTYHVSVFAAKQGCYNSDEATATLCWIDVDPKAEGIENDVANVKAMPVLIQGEDGVLHISGAPEGTAINVYEIGGQLVGSAKASSDTTIIPTTLPQGSIAIVKIGEKVVKVMMK